ncbi:arginine/serine-rich coiled-coil protein 2 isoform X1 [Sitophilus oryzae]|uniref:Arginine/serine-rich coiled-coil protein 2 isoform X1 n=1 Tax=Sitophilus oryzae TaxID=7048 RepID=A0A6J2YHM7_SITOR|nr:arginine/serine-rich coiled-coil protein 2 isoform X1 [Sitophilus oryzae]
MNSLMNYGSDDNSDDSGDDRIPEMPGLERNAPTKNYRKSGSQEEDNYDEVGMDMSEDSNDSSEQHKKQIEETSHKDKGKQSRQSADRRSSRSPNSRKNDEDTRNRRSEDRHGKSDREKSDRGRDRDSRDEDRARDRRNRDDRRDYRREERSSRDDRYNRDRRSDRDRERKRSRSRDRRRSRSPPRRSRSGSRGPSKGFRRDRASHRMDRLDKLGIPFKPDTYPSSALQGNSEGNSGDRFFMPGITGRFRDQIEKRKQLWQKGKDEPVVPVNIPGPSNNGSNINMAGSKAAKVYEATTFADDKTSSKFKRLMGIRETGGPNNLPTKSSEVLKKQEEMFSSMEAQYEVARTATHTMRGVGLGFGSFQR